MSKLSALCLGAALSLLAPGLRAEETTCRGRLSGSYDNINVPSGADCTLTYAYVQGTVYVRGNASLKVYSQTVILGNIQAEGARYVRLFGRGVYVNGSVQIKYGTAATTIKPGTQIGGSVQYVENSGFFLILGAWVGQDVQVFENAGGAAIYYNTINGNLQCKENEPPPTGDINTVGGNKEDQCATF